MGSELVDDPGPLKIYWPNIVYHVILHGFAFYGLFQVITGRAMWQTLIFATFLHVVGLVGTAAGAHRLWSHRAYKAKAPLKLLLLVMQTIALQVSAWKFARDHRVHHKYVDTMADSYSAKRGFFFSHMGWIFVRKTEICKIKTKLMDTSDLDSDPFVVHQNKYFFLYGIVLSIIAPSIIPWLLWEESVKIAFFTAFALRVTATMHSTFLGNSAAHMFGSRPYDKNVSATENKSVFLATVGEGWHNYHHAFSWDYKGAELGNQKMNLTTAFINLFAYIGWAYDMKTVSPLMVKLRAERTGDGSWQEQPPHLKSAPWGWGDKNIPKDDILATEILCPSKSG